MSKLTPEKRAAFLVLLTEGTSVSAAARGIGMTRQAMYLARDRDDEFKQAWDDAVEEGTDCLEDEAVKRAKTSSDTLLIFMLKARRPDKFKDRVANEHTGEVGYVLIGAPEPATADAWQEVHGPGKPK